MKINIWKISVDTGSKYLFIKISTSGTLFYNFYLLYKINCIPYNVYLNLLILIIVASTTSAPTSTPLVETSTPEIKESSSVTDTHSTYRTDSADITELHSNKKDTFDVKSAIIVSVSVASTTVFVSVVGCIIFCCIYKRKLSYPFQNTQHDASSNDPDIQVRVPLSTLETEVYMEIEDISPTQSGDLPDKDKDHVKTNYDQLSKTVSDSSKYSEIGKYYTDIEKYKTFTTHKALYHHRELKRHNSWHYEIEKPLNSRSPPFTRKANSYLELCEDSDYLEAVHKLKNIEACRDFIYANMNTSQLANPISSFHSKNAVSYDDFVSIIKEC